MKKIILALCLCICCMTPVFAADKQNLIQQHINSIGGIDIPNDTIDEFNSTYNGNLQYGMSIEEAYDQGILSDGNSGILTDFAHSKIGENSGSTQSDTCDYDPNSDMNMSTALDRCLSGSSLKNASGELRVESGVKQLIITWTNAIAGFLGLIAVGAIVYGAFMLTVSGGNEENVKKGKDAILWAMVGFLALVAASALVRVVVELIYDLA